MTVTSNEPRPRFGPLSMPRTPISKQSLELGALYREYADVIERWAVGLAGPHLDVEDIVHEVFLIAHRSLEKFRGEAKVTTFLERLRIMGGADAC